MSNPPASSPPPQGPPPAFASVPPISTPPQFRALAVFVIVLLVISMVILRRLLAPIIAGAWFAALSAPLVGRLSQRLGGRQRVATIAAGYWRS